MVLSPSQGQGQSKQASTLFAPQPQLKASGKRNPTQPKVGQARPVTNSSSPGVPSRYGEEENKRLKRELKRDLRIAKIPDKSGTIRLVETVPDCTIHYASARLFPFDTIAGACLPQSEFTFPSAKTKVTAAGTMSCGTSGLGYVVFAPKWGNDSGPIVTTTSLSVGGLGTALSAFTALQTINFPELPYPAASFGPNLQARYLAAGIRLSYTGKLMDQNGSMHAYCDPDHSSVSGNTPAQIMNLSSTKRRTVTGNVGAGDNWILQCTDNGPVVPAETSFTPAASVWVDPYMVMIVFGQPGDNYYLEVDMHLEMIGRLISNETPSHTDPTNFPIVDGVIKEAFETGPPQKEDSTSILTRIGQGISAMVPKIMSTITGFKALPPIVEGLLKVVPLTGSNPMLTGLNGFHSNDSSMSLDKTQKLLQYRQDRIRDGLYRGSNLYVSPETKFLQELCRMAVEKGVTPEDIFSALFPAHMESRRKSLPLPSRS